MRLFTNTVTVKREFPNPDYDPDEDRFLQPDDPDFDPQYIMVAMEEGMDCVIDENINFDYPSDDSSFYTLKGDAKMVCGRDKDIKVDDKIDEDYVVISRPQKGRKFQTCQLRKLRQT